MTSSRYAAFRFLTFVLLAGSALAFPAQTKSPDTLPTLVEEHEGPFVGAWAQEGQGFRANWNNGATASLTVQSFTSASVIISRTDLPTSTSAGMTALYSGQISAAGDSIVNGKVTWNWPGHTGYPFTSGWTASWIVLPPSGAQQQVPQQNTTPTVSFKQATVVPGSPAVGEERTTNSCVIQPYISKPPLQSTPLLVVLEYLFSKNLRLIIAPDGTWVPLAGTFQTDRTFPNLYSLPLKAAQSTYSFDLSQGGSLTITETGSSNSLIAGSGMTQLTGSENWSATETLDLNSHKDTLKFTASLNAQYIGGSQQQPGKAANCTINSAYLGEYSAIDSIVLTVLPAGFTPTQSLTVYIGGADGKGAYIPDQVAALQEVGIHNVVAARITTGIGVNLISVPLIRDRQKFDFLGVEIPWTLNSVLSIKDSGQTPINFVGYSYGSLIAAQCAAYYADAGRQVGTVVLIGSPISQTFLDELNNLQMKKKISRVIVMDLRGHGDEIYAGMPAFDVDNPLTWWAVLLQSYALQESGLGHFYYAPSNSTGMTRRRELARELWNDGLR